MNIAFVNPEYPSPSGFGHGGIATYIYNMANACALEGHTVHILARKGNIPDQLHPDIHLHEFEQARPSFAVIDRFRNDEIFWERCCAQAVKSLLLSLHRRQKIDIVEIPEYGGLAHELSGELPFRTVIHFHTPTLLIDQLNSVPMDKKRKRFHRFEKKACLRAHAFKSPSQALAHYVKKEMSVPAKQLQIIPTLMPTHDFDCIKKKSPPKNRINLLFAGRLERRKGAELLIDTANRILDLDNRIHITVVGETRLGTSNAYLERLERSIDAKNRDRMWLLGPQNRKRVATLYRRSSFFLMLSLFENAPNALLEAMAARLPVITTDGGGNTEYISHRRNGLVFPVGDRETLIDHINEYIKNPKSAKKMADQAYDDVKTMYNPSHIANQTLSFYRKIAEAV